MYEITCNNCGDIVIRPDTNERGYVCPYECGQPISRKPHPSEFEEIKMLPKHLWGK